MKLTAISSVECPSHQMLYTHTHTAPLRASCLLQVDHYHWVCVGIIVPCGTNIIYQKFVLLFLLVAFTIYHHVG